MAPVLRTDRNQEFDGKGRLVLAPDHPNFAQFLYWFHFANGTLQPATGRNMILGRLDLPADNPLIKAMKGRLDLALPVVIELGALGAEKFDAVIGKRIVAGADDHTQRCALCAGQIGHRRCRHRPQQNHIHAG